MVDVLKIIFGLLFIFSIFNIIIFSTIGLYDMFLSDYEYNIFKFLTRKVMDFILFITGFIFVYGTSTCLIIYIIVQVLEKHIK